MTKSQSEPVATEQFIAADDNLGGVRGLVVGSCLGCGFWTGLAVAAGAWLIWW